MNKTLGISLLLVYICVASALLSEAFTSPYNLQNVLRYTALYGILGIGVSMVIITGGIDLSIGSLVGLTGCVLPMLLVERQWSPWAGVVAVLLLATGLGWVHGQLITRMRLQPFIVTLCGLLIYRGAARWLTADQTKGFGTEFDNSLRVLATGKPCSLALLMLLGGIGLTGWAVWRARDDRRLQSTSAAERWPWAVLGSALAVAGAARFVPSELWLHFGTEERWLAWTGAATLADLPARMPQQLLRWLGWLALPSGVALLVQILRRPRPKSLWAALAAVGAGAALVWGAQRLTRLSDTALAQWPLAPHSMRMTSVFISLALLLGALGWLAPRVRATGEARARSLLWLTGGFVLLGLLGRTRLGEVLAPAPFLILLGVAGAASLFLNRTIYGRYLKALGFNEEAARQSGIRTSRMIVLAYALCGLASGVGGVLFALDGNSVQPAGHGSFLELYAIAAAVLGGCSLRGGEGGVLGVIIGAAVMRVLYNAINILGIPTQLDFAIIGIVILIGVSTDEVVQRVAARRQRVTGNG